MKRRESVLMHELWIEIVLLFHVYQCPCNLCIEVMYYCGVHCSHRCNGKPARQFQPSEEILEMVPALENILLPRGIPVYEGLNRASWAHSKVVQYSAFQQSCKP
jgi:hypothetical protein